jgi:hypothetical protein
MRRMARLAGRWWALVPGLAIGGVAAYAIAWSEGGIELERLGTPLVVIAVLGAASVVGVAGLAALSHPRTHAASRHLLIAAGSAVAAMFGGSAVLIALGLPSHDLYQPIASGWATLLPDPGTPLRAGADRVRGRCGSNAGDAVDWIEVLDIGSIGELTVDAHISPGDEDTGLLGDRTWHLQLVAHARRDSADQDVQADVWGWDGRLRPADAGPTPGGEGSGRFEVNGHSREDLALEPGDPEPTLPAGAGLPDTMSGELRWACEPWP